MKRIQGSYLRGYVKVLVKGERPERFFQACTNRGIAVWDIKKETNNTCSGNVALGDVKYLKQIKRETNDYKLRFIGRKGYPFLINQFFQKKPLLLGLCLSLLLIVFLSNIVWEVKITGVPNDLEEKITNQLEQYGVHRGSWSFTIDSPSVIQQRLLNDVPELLWVGVHKKGTTYMLEGVEKVVVEEEEVDGPRNLVATKKGVIQEMYVSKGVPKVQVNDYVEPGDVLVSGEIPSGQASEGEEENDDEKDEEEVELIAAEGDITAKTWYETNVEVPLSTNNETLTGNKEKKYAIRIGNIEFPIWGFKSPEYDQIHREKYEQPIHFLTWELPIKFVTTTLSEKEYHEVERTKEEAIDYGIKQAKQELQLHLGPKAEIISEKVLHETTENGKVKLTLYITVEEDIVKEEPINQGD
ncbi:sporulation protein YqfD [Oceanobacillus halotolerans]|uniref:sporulation protein YqfD n=1 Tax=Oceanobacillus halotolerans TaxID=2663380 RepID=UPI0013DD0176|nr:sporulation protein YqfD [Oceanobacillus halotolerans]